MRLPRRVRQRRRIRTRQAAAAVIVLCALGGASFAAYAHGSGAGVSAQHREMSAAWYVADSCKWTRADVRNCHTVLRFLAAFDLGRVEAACKQLSGLYLAQLTGGGLEGCKLFLRRDGSNRRIEYSISFSRLRPDGGEVLYTISPQGHRNLEQRYVATTVLEHGVSKIDSMTPIADPTRFLRSPLRDTGLRRHRLRNAFLARAAHTACASRAHTRVYLGANENCAGIRPWPWHAATQATVIPQP